METFDLPPSLGNLPFVRRAQSRSISPENPTGAKGGGARATEGTGREAARDLGLGWKVSPSIKLKPGSVCDLAAIAGPGVVQQVWMTQTGNWRDHILRIYWDGAENPAVECPVGDFFACGWGQFAPVSSLAVCVNPGSAFNCYWPMPFRQGCRVTYENRGTEETTLYYQINYSLQDVPVDSAYFHAQFRRVNPVPSKSAYTILDGVEGRGHYVGTYLCWGSNNNGWWGEGEVKFYLDGDGEFPTICGTGTEDYFCASYNFENQQTKQYETFNTPYAGLPQVIRPDGLYKSQLRFGMYRWHITDPVRFERDLRVTIQALGWRRDGRYLPLQDDISSVAYWYQIPPGKRFPGLPSRDALEII